MEWWEEAAGVINGQAQPGNAIVARDVEIRH